MGFPRFSYYSLHCITGFAIFVFHLLFWACPSISITFSRLGAGLTNCCFISILPSSLATREALGDDDTRQRQKEILTIHQSSKPKFYDTRRRDTIRAKVKCGRPRINSNYTKNACLTNRVYECPRNTNPPIIKHGLINITTLSILLLEPASDVTVCSSVFSLLLFLSGSLFPAQNFISYLICIWQIYCCCCGETCLFLFYVIQKPSAMIGFFFFIPPRWKSRRCVKKELCVDSNFFLSLLLFALCFFQKHSF